MACSFERKTAAAPPDRLSAGIVPPAGRRWWGQRQEGFTVSAAGWNCGARGAPARTAVASVLRIAQQPGDDERRVAPAGALGHVVCHVHAHDAAGGGALRHGDVARELEERRIQVDEVLADRADTG